MTTVSPYSEEQYFNKKWWIFFERVSFAWTIARRFSLRDIAMFCLHVSDSSTIGATWIRRSASAEFGDFSLFIEDTIDWDELDDVLFFNWVFSGGEIDTSDEKKRGRWLSEKNDWSTIWDDRLDLLFIDLLIRIFVFFLEIRLRLFCRLIRRSSII